MIFGFKTGSKKRSVQHPSTQDETLQNKPHQNSLAMYSLKPAISSIKGALLLKYIFEHQLSNVSSVYQYMTFTFDYLSLEI